MKTDRAQPIPCGITVKKIIFFFFFSFIDTIDTLPAHLHYSAFSPRYVTRALNIPTFNEEILDASWNITVRNAHIFSNENPSKSIVPCVHGFVLIIFAWRDSLRSKSSSGEISLTCDVASRRPRLLSFSSPSPLLSRSRPADGNRGENRFRTTFRYYARFRMQTQRYKADPLRAHNGLCHIRFPSPFRSPSVILYLALSLSLPPSRARVLLARPLSFPLTPVLSFRHSAMLHTVSQEERSILRQVIGREKVFARANMC